MGIAATIFLTLGILVIGFGLLSLCNILNLPLTDHQAKNADMTTSKFQAAQAKTMLMGAALIAIGVVLVLLEGI